MNTSGWAIPLAVGLLGFLYSAGRQLVGYDEDAPGLGTSLAGAAACAGILAVLIF